MLSQRSATALLVLTAAVLCNGTRSDAASTLSNEFTIRTGVNISHWLSQSDKRGEVRRNFMTKADFETIASMGFDHVRIPIDEVQLWDSTGHQEREAFGLLHSAIRWALDARLRVIVDLHIIRSHYFNAASNALWTDPAEQEKLADMWRQLSGELVQYPNSMLAYEILNEAVARNPEDWNKLVDKVVKAIRAKEPERKIVVGSNMWQFAGTFPDLRIPTNDKNIILSFHFYAPMALTHHRAPWTPIADYSGSVSYPGQIVDTSSYKMMSKAAVEFMRSGQNGFFTKDSLEQIMAPAIKVANDKKLPLYCGEFGIFPTIPKDVSARWYKDVTDILREHGVAFCHWNYKADFPVVDAMRMPDTMLVPILTAK